MMAAVTAPPIPAGLSAAEAARRFKQFSPNAVIGEQIHRVGEIGRAMYRDSRSKGCLIFRYAVTGFGLPPMLKRTRPFRAGEVSERGHVSLFLLHRVASVLDGLFQRCALPLGGFGFGRS
jgi:hypothetical protein